MGHARAGLVRNALGSLAIVGVVAIIAVGLPRLNRSIPAGKPMAAGAPYTVGARVSVVPPGGARLDVTKTRPGSQRGTVLFVIGGVRLVLVVTPFDGTLNDAAGRLRNKITLIAGNQVAGADRRISTGQGVAGMRGGYTSPGRVGQYAVFVAHDLTVEVTASGPDAAVRGLLAALEHSLRSVTFRGGP